MAAADMCSHILRDGIVLSGIGVFIIQVKMNRMRQRIAERLKDAQNTCAMLTTFNDIDMRSIISNNNRSSNN